MKPLTFGAINPYTGQKFTWGDKNLRWGSPSYYLEHTDPGWVPYDTPAPTPPPKKKKPFRRGKRLPDNPESTPTSTMSTFRYNVGPNSNGGFTTRAVRGHTVTQAALLGEVAALAEVSEAQAEAVIRAFLNRLLAHGATNGASSNLFDLVSFRATSGGSAQEADDFHNADDINAEVSISYLSEAIRNWRSTLSIESLGEVGKVTPVIEAVTRQSDKASNKYTALGLLQVRGNYMNFDPADVSQGLFFQPSAGAEVRATEYATIQPQSVVVLVPAGLTGPLTLRVATYINGSVRSYTYTDPLTTP